jgi:hypothetical protein
MSVHSEWKAYVDAKIADLEKTLLQHIEEDARIHTDMLIKINASLMEYVDSRMASTKDLLRKIHKDLDDGK